MKKAVTIVGPTAVGKTDLAIKIAKEYNGELVNSDAVQVFKELDIISGKDKEDLLDTKIHLLDITSPTEPFSVSQYEKYALKTISQIIDSQRLPIIVGGSGLYVRSIIDGVDTSVVKPNLELRERLDRLSVDELQSELEKLDVKTWRNLNDSDRKNKRRLIRKIEIIKSGARTNKLEKNRDIEFLQIGLEIDREKLKEKINNRVGSRIKEGAVAEAEKLFKNYENLTQQVKDANGYKQLFEHFLGKTTLVEAIEKWKYSEYRHAKNQMTWFKKDERVAWFQADEKDLFDSVRATMDIFLQG